MSSSSATFKIAKDRSSMYHFSHKVIPILPKSEVGIDACKKHAKKILRKSESDISKNREDGFVDQDLETRDRDIAELNIETCGMISFMYENNLISDEYTELHYFTLTLVQHIAKDKYLMNEFTLAGIFAKKGLPASKMVSALRAHNEELIDKLYADAGYENNELSIAYVISEDGEIITDPYDNVTKRMGIFPSRNDSDGVNETVKKRFRKELLKGLGLEAGKNRSGWESAIASASLGSDKNMGLLRSPEELFEEYRKFCEAGTRYLQKHTKELLSKNNNKEDYEFHSFTSGGKLGFSFKGVLSKSKVVDANGEISTEFTEDEKDEKMTLIEMCAELEEKDSDHFIKDKSEQQRAMFNKILKETPSLQKLIDKGARAEAGDDPLLNFKQKFCAMTYGQMEEQFVNPEYMEGVIPPIFLFTAHPYTKEDYAAGHNEQWDDFSTDESLLVSVPSLGLLNLSITDKRVSPLVKGLRNNPKFQQYFEEFKKDLDNV